MNLVYKGLKDSTTYTIKRWGSFTTCGVKEKKKKTITKKNIKNFFIDNLEVDKAVDYNKKGLIILLLTIRMN